MKKIVFLLLLNISLLPFGIAQLNILLVNDNDRSGDEDLIDSISQSLDRLAYSYTIYDAVAEGIAPPSSTMMQYDLCIWYCGRDGVDLNFWTASGQRNIKIFLDHGGMLWTMGRDIFYDEYGTSATTPVETFVAGDFAYDYLGLLEYHGQSHRNDSGVGCSQIDLVGGHSICSLDPVEWNDSDYDGKYIGAFSLTPSSTGVYNLGPPGYVFEDYYCSVYNEYNTGKTLTAEFSLSQIDSRPNRDQLIDQTLSYFFQQKRDLFNILLYNDNNNNSDHIDKVKDAISNAGYHYQDFNDYGFSSSPQNAFMKHFDLVIWVTGDDGLALNIWNATNTDNTEIENYIDGGGNFWLLGRDFLYDRYGGAGPDIFTAGSFVYDYLGIQEYHAQTFTDDGGLGVEQLDASNDNGIFTFSPIDWTFPALYYVDAIIPTANATKIYEMGPNTYFYDGYAAAVYNEKGNGKVLSFTFDPHYINFQSDADTIFAQGIRFFENENKLYISEIAYSQNDANSLFVEIYNAGSSDIDFSKQDWYLSFQDASTGTVTDIQLTGGTIAAGNVWVLTYSAADFLVSFGFAADQEDNSLNVSGDDPVYIYLAGDHSVGILKEQYGMTDEDGTDKDWDYTNAHAVRIRDKNRPNNVFTQEEWLIRNASTQEMTPGHHRADIVFNESSSTSWAAKDNWDLDILPDVSFNVSVPNGKTATLVSDGICNDLNIISGGKLEISSELDVAGNITNNAGNSGLTIKSTETTQGSLIHNNSNVPALVERYIKKYTAIDSDDGWHLLSSPLTSSSVSGISFHPGVNDDLYRWDEPTYYWRNYKQNPFNFDAGKGYLCAYESSTTKYFEGELSVYDITFNNLSFTVYNANPDDDGWHLLGNPFACALDWNQGDWHIDDVSIPQIYDEASGNYRALDDPLIVTENIIPSTQGFFIQVANNSNSITIPADARVHDEQKWYKNRADRKNTLSLKLQGGNNLFYDYTSISFNSDATLGYDIDKDSHKLMGVSAAPQLYTLGDFEEKFSVNHIPYSIDELIIPLNFRVPSSGTYEIVAAINTLAFNAEVYLEDIRTGIFTKLSHVSSYSFLANEEDIANRFLLHFYGVTAVNNPTHSSNLNIYANNHSVYLKAKETIKGNLIIYNIEGKLVFSKHLHSSNMHIIPTRLHQGIYIVHFIENETTTVEKIIIQ